MSDWSDEIAAIRGRYRTMADGTVVIAGIFVRDIETLLAEIDRLRAAPCPSCGDGPAARTALVDAIR